MLAALQAGLTGLLILRWTKGQASAGDVAFVIASFLLMSGYLRNIGDNIRMTQKALADVEDVARYARLAPQVPDRPGRAGLRRRGGGDCLRPMSPSAYKTARTPIYAGFSLVIAPGEREWRWSDRRVRASRPSSS